MWEKLFWTAVAVAVFSSQSYYILARFLRLLCHTYFRKIRVYGINNLPREGPVILCPNHPNMMIDVLLVVTECVKHGRNPFAWAKGSLFANPAVGALLRALGAVPVYRPKKVTDGVQDVDTDMSKEEIEAANKRMFEHSWKVLAAGNLMILFPEGTSYTAPKMLKLRTGVMRVAAGFVKGYDRPIPIIPVGLTYFNKDRFRSQVLLEFGTPLTLRPQDITSEAFLKDEFAEVKRLTTMLEDKMHDVTLNASDFSTIEVARMMRRLYLNTAASIDANKEVRLTQQIINMLEGEHPDDDTKTKIDKVRENVLRYREDLNRLRLKDQDIIAQIQTNSLMQMFLERMLYLLVLLPLATPGLALNFPFYFLAQKLNKAAGFTESKSMFKIFAAGVLVPIQWLFLILVAWWLLGSSYAYGLAVSLPLLLYSHIRVLEESRSIFENVNFLFNIAAHSDQVAKLRQERAPLVLEVQELVSSHVDGQIIASVKKEMEHSPKRRPLIKRVPSTSDTLLS
ncbi:TPA: hypothetical protein N0F65_011664 [Lagenidium giganteum]|uniref:Phospholipid/glycerol acyltransferase domain-containing protein n=1 Tax=Lagenidium giganteum TaxID=4803 RepID=A0AAV2ZFX7_9STRA|nr:TPA: hypothetical protein N0F65_011664 [Lagenidium giganteum]